MESKTLTLKKPLSIIQEAKLHQAVNSLLEQNKQRKHKVEAEALKLLFKKDVIAMKTKTNTNA